MPDQKSLPREEVDRITRQSRSLIAANPERFTALGAELDARFSHRRCWLQAVLRVNVDRRQTDMLDPGGSPFSSFSEVEIAEEWALWEKAWETGIPIERAAVPDEEPHYLEAYRMPMCDDPTYVKLLARGQQIAKPALLKEVWEATATAPSDHACARLVLLHWALIDKKGSEAKLVHTAFQGWPLQSRPDSRENQLLGRVFKCDGSLPYDAAEIVPGVMANFLADMPDTTWILGLRRAVDVLLNSEDFDPGYATRASLGKKAQKTKKSPGGQRKYFDNKKEQEMHHRKSREAKSSSGTTQVEYIRDKGLDKGYLKRARKMLIEEGKLWE